MTPEEAKRAAEHAIAAAIAEYEVRTGATVQRIEVARPPVSGSRTWAHIVDAPRGGVTLFDT